MKGTITSVVQFCGYKTYLVKLRRDEVLEKAVVKQI
jgi:hypothetical protein